MHHKNIKAQVRKQLKTHYPNWRGLPKKTKKQIARQVLSEVVSGYNFSDDVTTPLPELIGLSNQQPTKGIMTIDQMEDFVPKPTDWCFVQAARKTWASSGNQRYRVTDDRPNDR